MHAVPGRRSKENADLSPDRRSLGERSPGARGRHGPRGCGTRARP